MSIAALLAGCTGTAGSQAPFTDEGGMQGEYQHELAALSFPPSYLPPSDAPPGESGTSYEPGFGTSEADFAWLCAWMDEFMAVRTSDPARATRALDTLAGFPALELWAHMDPTGRQSILDDVASARRGDVTGIERQQAGMACHSSQPPASP